MARDGYGGEEHTVSLSFVLSQDTGTASTSSIPTKCTTVYNFKHSLQYKHPIYIHTYVPVHIASAGKDYNLKVAAFNYPVLKQTDQSSYEFR